MIRKTLREKWWIILFWFITVLIGWFFRAEAAIAPELSQYEQGKQFVQGEGESPSAGSFKQEMGVVPPILERIAFCESGNRQFDEDGHIIRGFIHPPDTGRFQINKAVHATSARELGFDLDTLEGNTAFAVHLYEEQGTRPWKASEKCWNK